MILNNTQIAVTPIKKLKQFSYGFLLLLLLFTLSSCGLISSKPTQVVENQNIVEEVEIPVLEASVDVGKIDTVTPAESDIQAEIALRFLTLEQDSHGLSNQTDNEHGYFWLDGIVKRIQYANGAITVVEVESAYDGEHYIVNADSSLLQELVKGQFVYLDGFYDTFSGFTALTYHKPADLLEQAISRSSIASGFEIATNTTYNFGQVVQTNKRKKHIVLSNGTKAILDDATSFYDAYSKEALTKNAFWRELSNEDKVYISTGQDQQTLAVWLVDEQKNTKAVVGIVKEVNNEKSEIVLASELWLLKDNKVSHQDSEVLVKLNRKTKIIATDGQFVSGSEVTDLVVGQQVVVEGMQKNRALSVDRLFLKEQKDLPIYVFGTVKRHKEGLKTIDLSVEWMFGLQPSTSVQVSINSFTELFEDGNEQLPLDKDVFWNLVSQSDEVEVEGYMLGDSLQAKRLILGNKEIELQSLSGTVDLISSGNSKKDIHNSRISLRLYSFVDDSIASLGQGQPFAELVLPFEDVDARLETQLNERQFGLQVERNELVNLKLSKDVEIQDIHGAETLLVEEFWNKLEPSDQLTVKGYFEDTTFVVIQVEFEDNDTTPFIFGEIEAFDASKRQIMLKGKNQVVLLTAGTSIKDRKLESLASEAFWSKLQPGDAIDIEGSYRDGVFLATKVFLSSKTQELDDESDNKDGFNIFDWLMN